VNGCTKQVENQSKKLELQINSVHDKINTYLQIELDATFKYNGTGGGLPKQIINYRPGGGRDIDRSRQRWR
jgi:hypothetical protein